MSGYYSFKSFYGIAHRCLGLYIENTLFRKSRVTKSKLQWRVENGVAKPIWSESIATPEILQKSKKKLPPIREDQKTLRGGANKNWQNRSTNGAAIASCGGLKGGAKRWK